MKVFSPDDIAIDDESLTDNSSLGLVYRTKIGGRRSFDEVVVKKCTNRPCLSDAEQELRTLDLVDHPNLAKMHGIVGLSDGVGVVVQPVRGQHLSERLYQLRSPDMKLRLEWVRGLIAGMGALHEKHIVHGNLTPDNVVFNEDDSDVPMLTDYGMARFYERHVPDWRLNERYTAPEVTSADLCCVKSDIFSLGLVIWQILTLQRLPESSQPNLAAIEDAKKRTILSRCLSISPYDRPDLQELEAAFAKTCYCKEP